MTPSARNEVGYGRRIVEADEFDPDGALLVLCSTVMVEAVVADAQGDAGHGRVGDREGLSRACDGADVADGEPADRVTARWTAFSASVGVTLLKVGPAARTPHSPDRTPPAIDGSYTLGRRWRWSSTVSTSGWGVPQPDVRTEPALSVWLGPVLALMDSRRRGS